MQVANSERTKYLEEQLLCLQASGHVLEIRIANDNKAALERGSLVVADAKVYLNGAVVQLHIGLDRNFPNSLPIIMIVPGSVSGFIPHIESDGFVCYAEKGNSVINSSVPEKVLVEAIDKAKAVLANGISGNNKLDFIDEFDAYWRAYQSASQIKSFINPTEEARKIVVARSVDKTDGIDIAYLSDNDTVPKEFGIESKTRALENGIYVPLQRGAYIDLFSKTTLTVKDFRKAVADNVSPLTRKRLKQLSHKYKRDEVVVFRLPRPSVGEVLFGVLFSGVHGGHPLNDQGKVEKIIPLAMDRMDKSYLLPRGGASSFLQNKNVALVGCGAVGGHIAFELVQSGILNLTLVDSDVMKPENIFRHVLGKEYLGKPKAHALKSTLESRFPYIKIRSFAITIEEAISKSLLELNKFDLIVMATGDDNLSLRFNEEILFQRIKTPVLYSWLEPHGIGGHVLITNLERKGCFHCLFTSLEDGNEFSNRASFVAPGQTFTKDISGCANRFTPFSSLDASNTAALTVRTAFKILTGIIRNNGLLSWKGEADEFVDQGFQVSDRYRNLEVPVDGKGVNVYSPFCPICNEG